MGTKLTFGEWLQALTILVVWGVSVFMLYAYGSFWIAFVWSIATIPGIICWSNSIIKLQILEGRRKKDEP